MHPPLPSGRLAARTGHDLDNAGAWLLRRRYEESLLGERPELRQPLQVVRSRSLTDCPGLRQLLTGEAAAIP